jgi:hypothetical protein
MLIGVMLAASPQRTAAVVVMNYGADGNDYFQFTTPSMAFDKASGFTTLITFAMHVNPDGTLIIAGVACTNGVYVGPTNWGSLVATLKAPPTTVARYEVCIGGWEDSSYDNIKSLVAAQGTGPGSILYKNFQALKNAVPGIDAINDDDEQTYDLNSSTNFANMLGALGYKFTLVPYTAQSFWVNLKNNLTNCDYVYLQCYEGGAGNDPGQWNAAFGHGVVVIPGQESNTANPATFHNWYLETGVQGGFYYPDIVFNSTYWSAAIIEGNGAAPGAPMGVTAGPGGRQVALSWNTVPGAISYNVKRSTSSGGETAIANVSTANNWPASNRYTDAGLSTGTAYYYEVSAVNTNGESLNSAEVGVTPQAATVVNPSFESDAAASGGEVANVPTGWTAFNEAGSSDIGSQNAGGTDYTVYDPLAAPAEGSQYCFVNMFNSSVTGGIYQDAGPLQTNTTYSLIVAIGSRHDRINSPGIISLLNGVNNTGTVLASGGGLPPAQNSWQDYAVTFTTGAQVSGDLTVELSVLGNGTTIQADFDNVRLKTTPGVISTTSSQTGSGSGTFYPSWTVVTNGSLIAGRIPSTALGNFSEEAPGRNVNSLTAGGSLGLAKITGTSGSTTSTNYVTCGNGVGPDGSSAGSTIIYALPAATNGYDLTNITVYGGWADNGRDEQAYTVYYSAASAPTNFLFLAVVSYNPPIAGGIQSATRVTLTSELGVLATNAAAIKFDFTSPAAENGYCGYAGINVFGTPSTGPAVPAGLNATVLTPGSFVINVGNLVVGRHYVLESATNLAAAVWSVETNFVATQTTAVWSKSGGASPQEFYRIVGN